MKQSSTYTRDYFAGDEALTARRSAAALVPAILDLIHPTSVVDVGCGTGEFLAAFQEHGVDDILGIDGRYVDKDLLAIREKQFRAIDISRPFTLDRTYDLAFCLEVAEHLAPESASGFIESLTRLAPVILFSAAIPRQGGVHHVNEQWPSYWATFFEQHGFIVVDALRKRIWEDQTIDVWYRQNILFFCSAAALAGNPALAREAETTNRRMLSAVHPELYLLGYRTPGPSMVTRLRRQVRKITWLRTPYRRIKNRISESR